MKREHAKEMSSQQEEMTTMQTQLAFLKDVYEGVRERQTKMRNDGEPAGNSSKQQPPGRRRPGQAHARGSGAQNRQNGNNANGPRRVAIGQTYIHPHAPNQHSMQSSGHSLHQYLGDNNANQAHNYNASYSNGTVVVRGNRANTRESDGMMTGGGGPDNLSEYGYVFFCFFFLLSVLYFFFFVFG